MKKSVPHAVSYNILRSMEIVGFSDFGSDNAFCPGRTSNGITLASGGTEVLRTVRDAQDDIIGMKERGMKYEEGRIPNRSDPPFVLCDHDIAYDHLEDPYESYPVPERRMPERVVDSIQSQPTEMDHSMKMLVKNDPDGSRPIFLMKLDSNCCPPPFLQMTAFPMHIQPEFLTRAEREQGVSFCHGLRFTFKPRHELEGDEVSNEFRFRHQLKKKFGLDILPGGSLDIYNILFGHFLKHNMTRAPSGWGKDSVDGSIRAIHDMRGGIRLMTDTLQRYVHLLGNGKELTDITHTIRLEVGNSMPNDQTREQFPLTNPFGSDMLERMIRKMVDQKKVEKLLKFLGGNISVKYLSSIKYLENIQSTLNQWSTYCRGIHDKTNLTIPRYSPWLRIIKTGVAFVLNSMGVYTSDTSKLVKSAKQNPKKMELLMPATKSKFEKQIPRHRSPNPQTCGGEQPLDKLFGHVVQVSCEEGSMDGPEEGSVEGFEKGSIEGSVERSVVGSNEVS